MPSHAVGLQTFNEHMELDEGEPCSSKPAGPPPMIRQSSVSVREPISDVNQLFGFLLVLMKHPSEMHAFAAQERLRSANVPLAVPRPSYV